MTVQKLIPICWSSQTFPANHTSQWPLSSTVLFGQKKAFYPHLNDLQESTSWKVERWTSFSGNLDGSACSRWGFAHHILWQHERRNPPSWWTRSTPTTTPRIRQCTDCMLQNTIICELWIYPVKFCCLQATLSGNAVLYCWWHKWEEGVFLLDS